MEYDATRTFSSSLSGNQDSAVHFAADQLKLGLESLLRESGDVSPGRKRIFGVDLKLAKPPQFIEPSRLEHSQAHTNTYTHTERNDLGGDGILGTPNIQFK